MKFRISGKGSYPLTLLKIAYLVPCSLVIYPIAVIVEGVRVMGTPMVIIRGVAEMLTDAKKRDAAGKSTP